MLSAALAAGFLSSSWSLGAVAAPRKIPAGQVVAIIDGPAGRREVPLFSRAAASLTIAEVGNRTVTLSELADALATAHEGRGAPAAGKAPRKDATAVLDRLVGVRLIVQEAQAIGLDELEQIKAGLRESADKALREELQRIALRGVKADPGEVRRLHREASREWKVRSALFEKEEDAKAVLAEVKASTAFEEALRKALAAGKASGAGEAQFMSARAEVLPQVFEALRGAKIGQVAGPIRVERGFALLRVEEVRYREDAKARAEAEKQALAKAKSAALRGYYAGLVKRYTRTDHALLDALDFEAKEPGFAALAKDSRVLVRIDGGDPVRISDLAAEARRAFFHSVERAVEQKRVNDKKAVFLDAIVSRRLVALEAARLGVAESDEYKRALSRRRDELLFGIFVQRVILPDLKITEADLQAYYAEHAAELRYPAFYSLHSLSFTSGRAARQAMAQLKAGADLGWLKTNAQDQVPPEKRVVDLDGSTVSANGVTPQVAKAIQGAQSGDVRLMEQNGQHVLLVVRQVTAEAPRPYAEARESIAPKMQQELAEKSLEQWIAKLRKAYPVKVYVHRIVT